jgi:hypothetical protein
MSATPMVSSSTSVLIDWTSTRKRTLQSSADEVVNDGSIVDENENENESSDADDQEAPFSFVKKARKCKLECCSPLWALASSDGDHDTLSFSQLTIVFLPPPCDVSWFSGVCSFSSSFNSEEDDDPFMEKDIPSEPALSSSGATTTTKKQKTIIGILGHELEIDDCLKCADGGYQNFR